WRTALSDNNSAYVEIQAGLFRDQETYGFLEPQESRSFTEYWMPIRDLGGVSRANPDAVLNLNRHANSTGVDLEVAFNVSKELPNATVTVLNGTKTVASARTPMSPRQTFSKTFAGLPAAAAYTVELRNGEQLVIRHTENQYDFVSRDQVRLGKQPSYTYPAEASFGADDFVHLANEQETNGELLIALETYQKGLARFPESIALNKGAGRLETSLAQYGNAVPHLSKALLWKSEDHETAYYLGIADEAQNQLRDARTHLDFAQQSEEFHAPALMELAGIEARAGDRNRALALIE